MIETIKEESSFVKVIETIKEESSFVTMTTINLQKGRKSGDLVIAIIVNTKLYSRSKLLDEAKV